MPAYGSCAGMIMLAAEVLDGRPDQRALGALDMTVRRNAFGRQVDSFEADVDLDGAGAVPRRVHPRAVGRAGGRRTSRCWAASAPDRPTVGSSRYASGTSLATAFHPELTGDLRVHRLFVDMARRAKSTEE